METAQALRGTDRGAVTLVVVGTLASITVTEHLRRCRDAHPAIDLRLRTALNREVSDLVRRGDAILGLRYGADPNPEAVSTVCRPARLTRRRRGRGNPGSTDAHSPPHGARRHPGSPPSRAQPVRTAWVTSFPRGRRRAGRTVSPRSGLTLATGPMRPPVVP
jgi:DNA-binding transcriptional LysR family regulator